MYSHIWWKIIVEHEPIFNEYINLIRKKNRNKPKLSVLLEDASEMYMTRMRSHRHKARVDMAQTRDPRDIPSSFRLIFDVPTFLAMTSRAQPRGDPMKSNRRANPLQTTSRVVPGWLVLENDVATSRSNWPAELRSGRQGSTITILLIADAYDGPRGIMLTLHPDDRMTKPKVTVVQMRNRVSVMHFYATTTSIQLQALCSRLDYIIDQFGPPLW